MLILLGHTSAGGEAARNDHQPEATWVVPLHTASIQFHPQRGRDVSPSSPCERHHPEQAGLTVHVQ